MKYKSWSLLKNLALTEHETKRQCSLKEFIRQIDLNKSKLKKIESLLAGPFQSTKIGTGFDFNEIREYKMGDDLRHISWSTTAKTGTLHTKEYFAEKEITSYFLIDISNSMLCGNKLDPFVQLFAFLLNLSSRLSEKIGGVFFSHDINYIFPIEHANTQANIIFQTFINFIYDINKKVSIPSTYTNLYKALEFTQKHFHKKGFVYLISDFVNLANWEKSIFQTSQKQNIYSFQIYDPIDFQLPKNGYVTIIDPETNQRCIVNTDNKLTQESYYKTMIQRQEELKSFLKKIGVHHMAIEKSDFE